MKAPPLTYQGMLAQDAGNQRGGRQANAQNMKYAKWAYARCIMSHETTSPSTLALQFSHTNYAQLYSVALNKSIQDTDSCNVIYDQKKAIKLIFTISWTNEGDDFIFQKEEDAKFWERIVRLCSTVSPLQKRIKTELEGKAFREMLEISEQEWSETWCAAVPAPKPEITPQYQPPLSTATVAEEGTRIRRSVARFGSRFSIRVRFPRFSTKKKNKRQNEEVAKETTPAA
ncbi:hypothetical protein FCIRC_10819 [Fusarium circinatum]|uniref:Uncharacterized protein n=1 Tax=Fusarium circinatum TaxID=48490 RepID=A0A8H5T7P0_FUSCI|nr:hypothetical protein FCIRC_10819 [Fusarium circinatum]